MNAAITSSASSATDPRIDFAAFEKAVPGAVAALRDLGQAVTATGLDKKLVELLKVRVSQINGCGYCLMLHLDWARKAGVPARQLDLVAVWREVGSFDARERAALEWAEVLTDINRAHVDDAAYQRVAEHFSSNELSALTAAIANINAWNRICGPLRFALPG